MTARRSRERLGWDIAAIALFAVITTIATTQPESFPGSRTALIAIALALLLVYFLGARRYVSIFGSAEPSVLGSAILQTLMIGLLAAGTAIEPNMLLLQALVLPLIWMTARGTRPALIVTVLTGFILGAAYALPSGFTSEALFAGYLTSFLSSAFSIAIGLWITHVVDWGAERERLYADLAAAQRGMAAASHEAGVLAERARLSRDLHDTITQSLASIVMLSERARRDGSPTAVEAIEDAAREALHEARTLVATTSPAPSSSMSLGDALRRLGDRLARETGMSVRVSASDTVLPRDLQVVLLRCAQEALANVRKHSRAASAAVGFGVTDGVAGLTVRDDGRGLGGVSIEDDRGFGLVGMRDRVGLVGGTLTVRDAVPSGVELHVRIPVAPATDPVSALEPGSAPTAEENP